MGAKWSQRGSGALKGRDGVCVYPEQQSQAYGSKAQQQRVMFTRTHASSPSTPRPTSILAWVWWSRPGAPQVRSQRQQEGFNVVCCGFLVLKLKYAKFFFLKRVHDFEAVLLEPRSKPKSWALCFCFLLLKNAADSTDFTELL